MEEKAGSANGALHLFLRSWKQGTADCTRGFFLLDPYKTRRWHVWKPIIEMNSNKTRFSSTAAAQKRMEQSLPRLRQ